MSAKKEEAAEGGETKPKSKKKLIFIVVGLVVLVAGAGVPMFLMGGAEEAEVVEEEHEEVKRLESADLGVYVVNLSETSAFLKTRIMIEFDAASVEKQTGGLEGGEGGGKGHGGGAGGGGGEPKPGGLPPHFMKRESQMKDAVIRILSSKRADDLLTAEGKERLKDELLEGINEAVGLEEPPVVGVFFTEFIIQ
jgi:flagellar basal body-associated protein FliL